MDGRDLRIYNERTAKCQLLCGEADFLRSDRNWLRVELFHASQQFCDLEAVNRRLTEENGKLELRVAELTASLRSAATAGDAESGPPAFVKASLPARRRRRKPGRKEGHPAALRPMPEQIDR